MYGAGERPGTGIASVPRKQSVGIYLRFTVV
jgi:hypothetical protein